MKEEEIKHQLEYSVYSCKVTWCPICCEHFYNERNKSCTTKDTSEHYHTIPVPVKPVDEWKCINRIGEAKDSLDNVEVLFEDGTIIDYMRNVWPFSVSVGWRFKNAAYVKPSPIDASRNRVQLSNITDQNGIDFNWLKIWEQVEIWYGDHTKKESGRDLLLRLQSEFSPHVKPVDVETDPYFIRQFDSDKYYWCKCENCGWEDSSEFTEGCHAIADTGDHSDPVCPICGCNKLEGDSAIDPDKQYEGIVEVEIPVALILSAHKKTIDQLNESLERFRYPAPVKPIDNGITVLINKINERIRLIPDEPNLSQRGALDAYLNVISWANDKAIDNPSLNTPIQSGVEDAADTPYSQILSSFKKSASQLMDLQGSPSHTEPIKQSLQEISKAAKDYADKNAKTLWNKASELENAFFAGAEWQAQQVKQPVMQWVKASENNLPATNTEVFIKFDNGQQKEKGDRNLIIELLENGRLDIEWLEEPPIQ